MRNARLPFALLLAAAAACSTAHPTGPLPEAPRASTYGGGGTTVPDTTQKTDPAKPGG